MRPMTSGPGRMVQDASYFVSLLRGKSTEIGGEIARMKGEIQRTASNASLLAQYERRYETLLKEVGSLEGDLADLNLATDKSRTRTEAGDVQALRAAVRRRNEGVAKEVDAIFMERAEREKGAARLEEMIEELTRAAESKLASLHPSQVAEYRALGEERAALADDKAAAQGDLEALNAQIGAVEAALGRDSIREEYLLFKKKSSSLAREKSVLETELSAARLAPGEARDFLLQRVKEDTAATQSIEKMMASMNEKITMQRKVSRECVGGGLVRVVQRRVSPFDFVSTERHTCPSFFPCLTSLPLSLRLIAHTLLLHVIPLPCPPRRPSTSWSLS
jgi:intraflagellar transport protein 74